MRPDTVLEPLVVIRWEKCTVSGFDPRMLGILFQCSASQAILPSLLHFPCFIYLIQCGFCSLPCQTNTVQAHFDARGRGKWKTILGLDYGTLIIRPKKIAVFPLTCWKKNWSVGITELLEECVRRLLTWIEAMEKKGLRLNAGKTKIMICDMGLGLLQSTGEFPCAVCHTGVGSNSIFCNGCKYWVHKNAVGSSTWQRTLTRCTQCQGTACPLDGRPQKEVQVGPDKLEVVAFFCYPHVGDMLSAAGGCELSTTTCVKTTWKKFKDLLSVLSSGHLSFKTLGRVYSSCVQSAMLHASETWPLTKPNLQCLRRNDRAVIRQICSIRPQDIVTTRSCSAWHWGPGPHSEGEKAPLVWTCGTLQWCSKDSLSQTGWGKAWAWEAQDDMEAADREGLLSGSSRLSTLMVDIPGDLVWDLPLVQQASYLEGGPLMWMLPLSLQVNQKSDYDMR